MLGKKCWCFYAVLHLVHGAIESEDKSRAEYFQWSLNYPEGTTLGMFLAIAVPLSLPRSNAYLAFNYEANYRLPNNQSLLTYPPIVTERISRQSIYDILEMKLKSQGYPGRNCLLRVICEAATVELDKINGVLGDIVDIVLSPSSSRNRNLSEEYVKAEEYGRRYEHCQKFNKTCSVSFLDLISSLCGVADV